MNYFISDLHFGCQNKFDGKTLEHDKLIKQRWNAIVHNNDTVYILGDIGREGGNKDNEYLCELISTLKGNKVLIQGNHEKLKDNRLRQLFIEITPYKEITDNYNGLNHNLVLSHYPISFWNGQHKGWIHLYGHVQVLTQHLTGLTTDVNGCIFLDLAVDDYILIGATTKDFSAGYGPFFTIGIWQQYGTYKYMLRLTDIAGAAKASSHYWADIHYIEREV